MEPAKHRLSTGDGINRNRPVRFWFDGKPYTGFEGDTIASALLASGVLLMGRSFKYHRPRGVIATGVQECNALLKLGSGPFQEPNVRATMQPIFEGLVAESQNCWPSVKWDLWSITGIFAKALPAGFYYKTFMWPSWHFWEGLIRKASGLGEVPNELDAQSYVKRHGHCDVLVVGSGPAGLSAAMEAARHGASVVLVDEQENFGGTLLWEQGTVDGLSLASWAHDVVRHLETLDNVALHRRCTVSGYYDHNCIVMCERLTDHQAAPLSDNQPRQRLWKLRAKKVILATGAHERPSVFPNNDRPGLMLASAVREYITWYGVCLGKRAVVVTNNNDAYKSVLLLKSAGIEVAAVIDSRSTPSGVLVEQARHADIPILSGCVVVDTKGRRRVSKVVVGDAEPSSPGRETVEIACDLVAVSAGYSPVVHLFSQAGGDLEYCEELACFRPLSKEKCNGSLEVAGSANGNFSLSGCLREGTDVARTALAELGLSIDEKPLALEVDCIDELDIQAQWRTSGIKEGKQWVDFQHDVTVSDIEVAARENYVSVEHFKRYTTTGMSVDQGKTSNVNGLANLAIATSREIAEVGTTKFRPPFTPVTLGAVAGLDLGDLYRPRLEMPVHDDHCRLNAHFEDSAGWQRPTYYRSSNETAEAAIYREMAAVRNTVSLFEGSPLGKIEVVGRQAQEFLNRIYMNNVCRVGIGQVGYGLMLNELGVVIDDGVFARLAEDHYLVSASSGAADRIQRWMEEWAWTEWRDLDVVIAPVTQQWATLTLSGPKARSVIQSLASDIDFSAAAFPHMAIRTGVIEGVEVRVLRVSLTGELTYEINVPADYGASFWRLLLEQGRSLGIVPLGLEALVSLRIDKGYLHIGGDTDGATLPDDIGWGAPARKKTSDYLGKRSLSLNANRQTGRKQLVGYELLGSRTGEFLPPGSHIVEADTSSRSGLNSVGYVTSSYFSPHLNRAVAIGVLRDGRARHGEVVKAYADGVQYQAKVVAPVFYDPEGHRLNA